MHRTVWLRFTSFCGSSLLLSLITMSEQIEAKSVNRSDFSTTAQTVELTALSNSAAEPVDFDQLIVFGDSLSDTGTGQPPSPPDFGDRASNGPLVVDLLADLDLAPLMPPLAGGTNFAVGGNTSGDLDEQLDLYRETDNRPASDDLFFIWIGANDLLDQERPPNQIIENIAEHVTALAEQGAETFAIANLPPLGFVPAVNGEIADELNAASDEFNQRLSDQIVALETSLGIEIYSLDTARAAEIILADPERFGLTNVTDPAINKETGDVVDNPDEFFFWDPIHPSAAGHAALFNLAVADALKLGQGVIEPTLYGNTTPFSQGLNPDVKILNPRLTP